MLLFTFILLNAGLPRPNGGSFWDIGFIIHVDLFSKSLRWIYNYNYTINIPTCTIFLYESFSDLLAFEFIVAIIVELLLHVHVIFPGNVLKTMYLKCFILFWCFTNVFCHSVTRYLHIFYTKRFKFIFVHDEMSIQYMYAEFYWHVLIYRYTCTSIYILESCCISVMSHDTNDNDMLNACFNIHSILMKTRSHYILYIHLNVFI